MKIEKRIKFTKSNLPTKICETCGKPFAWRKRWEKVWTEVKYCSEKCRRRERGQPVCNGAKAASES